MYIYGIQYIFIMYIYGIQFEYSIPYRKLAQVGFKPTTLWLPCTWSNHCYCYYIYIYIYIIYRFIYMYCIYIYLYIYINN